MLRHILDAGLRADVHVVFADTGKERRETYAFVEECERRWGVPIHRVQRATPAGVIPFEQLLIDRGYLPTPTMRMCTQELKIRPMKRFMRERGYEEWTMVVGIRADEPQRVARLRGESRERWTHALL
jgi:3'-phosphoadenosine 5'-phosphosulfate sulfotransferase (PAPS reductase)/FAD synthetase